MVALTPVTTDLAAQKFENNLLVILKLVKA